MMPPMARPTLEAMMEAGFTLVIDCSDPDRLSRFWAAALGYEAAPPPALVGNVRLLVHRRPDTVPAMVGEQAESARPDHLADRRGVLLDQLSNLIGVRVLDRGNGSIGVVVGDSVLVDGGTTRQLQAIGLPNGGLGVGYVGTAAAIDPGSGQLAALADLTDNGIPGIRGQLDQLVDNLVATRLSTS